MDEPEKQAPEKKPSLNPLQVIASVFAAGLGVQSSKNRERDFSKGKPGQFIAIGIIFTALFVLIMIGIVNLVLSFVGGA